MRSKEIVFHDMRSEYAGLPIDRDRGSTLTVPYLCDNSEYLDNVYIRFRLFVNMIPYFTRRI